MNIQEIVAKFDSQIISMSFEDKSRKWGIAYCHICTTVYNTDSRIDCNSAVPGKAFYHCQIHKMVQKGSVRPHIPLGSSDYSCDQHYAWEIYQSSHSHKPHIA